MASWLKVAEDLLEVVDRRAKLVVSELSEEQSDLQASASNEWEVKAKNLKSKAKGPPRKTVGKTGKSASAEQEQTAQEELNSKVERVDHLGNGSAPEVSAKITSEASLEVLSNTSKDVEISNAASSGVPETLEAENETNEVKEVPTIENNVELAYSTTNDTSLVANSEEVKGEGPENANGNHPADTVFKGSAAVVDTHLAFNDVSRERQTAQKHVISNGHEKESFPEESPMTNQQVENKTGSALMKVQDQIDEAQGLLKTAVSSGHSKEARLAKVCAGLSSRLQEYKSENAQLEELLVAERELSSSYEARIKQLQQDLSAVKAEAARAETNMTEALAAKNTEIESLVGTVDTLKKQVSTSEGKLVSLQANMEALMRSRELTESRMIQALREELATVENRAEAERAAHNATKMAAVEREVELEHRAVEASNALARIQRTAHESTSRANELEHKVALLEVECSSLTQELQEMEACSRRGQKKPSEENIQILQIQAWQEEVERARQCQREAENKISSMEAELQKMRVEMAGMKRDADHYSRQEHMELEKRYRELTDLLYHKQTQLEAMASEKAAAEFQIEKEIKRLQEAQVEAERSRASRRSTAFWEEDADIKALEYLCICS
ncbi:golgin-84 isoform X2 [Dendrobium catenatum]|uniref:golgin-84 isoform X2 n=1 Tax=Dendrobium catenatum TaxID=906689 RepID=UPI0009F2BF6A|nr:golgin-84 isoform X2 [Dendrobium catenatum]